MAEVSDRKYRQRGYQDEPRDRPPADGQKREARRDGAPRGQPPLRPSAPVMPGFREVARCARCGEDLAPDVAPDSRCRRCGADLHACAQCASFDAGARFECLQPIPARVSPKDARNDCAYFEPRVTVERETKSSGPPDARKAFDDLFR